MSHYMMEWNFACLLSLRSNVPDKLFGRRVIFQLFCRYSYAQHTQHAHIFTWKHHIWYHRDGERERERKKRVTAVAAGIAGKPNRINHSEHE